MITGGIQFVHISVYSLQAPKKTSRGADRKWSVRDVLAEASRAPQACLHVPRPKPPVMLHGPSLAELETEVGAIHARSRDAVGRQLRKDASVLLAGVASYPRHGIEYSNWKQCALEWLQLEFGDRLRSVVEHTDEAHPHFHFFVVNPDGGNVKDVHPGFRAAKGAQTPKEQRFAYNAGMRAFQDRFLGARGRAIWPRSLGAGSSAHESGAMDEGEVRATRSSCATSTCARDRTRHWRTRPPTALICRKNHARSAGSD